MERPHFELPDPLIADQLAAARGWIVGLCVGWVRDRHVAEELAQEALRVAWERRAEFRPAEGTPRSWAAGIARNLCRAQARKVADLLTEDGVIEAQSPASNALAALRAEEQEELLLRALIDLPEAEQDALYARYVEGLSRAEHAERLGTSDEGVRALLQRSRRHLERVLRGELEILAESSSFFRDTNP